MAADANNKLRWRWIWSSLIWHSISAISPIAGFATPYAMQPRKLAASSCSTCQLPGLSRTPSELHWSASRETIAGGVAERRWRPCANSGS